jgi:hypothetical protein
LSGEVVSDGGAVACPDAPVYRGRFFGKPNIPLLPVWKKGVEGMLTGVDVLARPCVPSPVSAIRTPKLPLLPVWEKGAGGMRGNGARE